MLKTTLSMGNLLFESPWPIVLGLVVVWAAMRVVGSRLLDGEREAMGKRLRRASWALLVVAGLVYGLAWYVQTPAERLALTMRQLLAAVEQEDWATFDKLTADDATGRYMGFEFSRALMDRQLQTYKVEDITLLSEDVVYFPDLEEGVTGVQLRVKGQVDMAGLGGVVGMDVSVWAIHWRMRADSQWIATRFEHQGSGIDAVLGE